ncbi:BRO1 domain-containing protein [Schizosaccharomyces octosporus yFS286]|uniref:BRO1 domain-containing protein n=1 Tax=Schizosaccharomyces octosporus (strain yFS286) TaxID=483514 RepID=S9R8R4_SCHOY|nr:BRO1 domain-containing protein [Schizosaccharomyces octosporus yFS286]EPX74575.1 BRO1 domain-containing protein [Schizosaccharomyces octosporus yFS286]
MDLIELPLKNTSPLDIEVWIKDLSEYPTVTKENLRKELEEYQELRKKLCVDFPTFQDAQLANVYYRMLGALEEKLAGSAPTSFTWNFSYSSSQLEEYNDICFEKANFIYRMANVYQTQAKACLLKQEPNFAQAHQFLQFCAGSFNFIGKYCLYLGSLDFEHSLIKAWEHCFLAQAQSLVYHKGLLTKSIRDLTLSKLANGIAKMYDDAHHSFENSTGAQSYFVHVTFLESLYYRASSYFYLSKDAVSKYMYGKQVAFLELAVVYCKKALAKRFEVPTSIKVYENLEILLSDLQDQFRQAKRDNDFVHLEQVPSLQDISSCEIVMMVQSAIPDYISSLSNTFRYFPSIVDNKDQRRWEQFRDKAKIILKAYENDMLNLTTEGDDIVDKLKNRIAYYYCNDDKFIKDLGATEKKYDKIKESGGQELLRTRITSLMTLSKDVSNVFHQSNDILNNEQEKNDFYKLKYGTDRWKIVSSEIASRELRNELESLRINLINFENLANDTKKLYDKINPIYLTTEPKLLITNFSSTTETLSPLEINFLSTINNQIQRWESIKETRSSIGLHEIESQYFSKMTSLMTSDPNILISGFKEELSKLWNTNEQKQSQTRLFDSISESIDNLARAYDARQKKKSATQILLDINEMYELYWEAMNRSETGVTFGNRLLDLFTKIELECTGYANQRTEEAVSLIEKISTPTQKLFNPNIHQIRFKK